MWKVYIVSWFITALFTIICFTALRPAMTVEGDKFFSFYVILKIGALSGLLFGLMMTLMISMTRSSNKFWEYSEEVSKLIDEAETKEALNGIYNNEFKNLKDLMGGRPHLEEVKKLRAIMETKMKYVK